MEITVKVSFKALRISLIILSFSMVTSAFREAEAVQLLGNAVAISTAPGGEKFAAVAHNTVDNRFLVAWMDGRDNAITGKNILGQMVNPDGTLVGGVIAISTAVGDQSRPAVAYNSIDNTFLVIWTDKRTAATTQADIFGQVISQDGVLIGENSPISIAAKDQDRSRLAYDPVENRFLAVWQDSRNRGLAKKDIFGQLIQADGALFGGNLAITSATNIQDRPDVAYDAAAQQFLAVWTDFRNSATTGTDIFGQVVTPDGTLSGGNVPISTADGDQFRPALAYDAVDNLFLMVWTDCRLNVGVCSEALAAGTDIFGQLVDGGGTALAESVPIATEAAPQFRPAVAFSSVDQRFLVIWTDDRDTATTGNHIFAQEINPDGTLLGGSVNLTPSSPPSTNPARQERSAIAYNPVDNQFLAAYSDDRNGGRIDLFGQFADLSQ